MRHSLSANGPLPLPFITLHLASYGANRRKSRPLEAALTAAVLCAKLPFLPASRRAVGCSAQLQKDAPATARDDMAARALEFFGLLPRQVTPAAAAQRIPLLSSCVCCDDRIHAAYILVSDAARIGLVVHVF